MNQQILEKRRAHTPYGDIAFLESGKRGKPPILFVHGIPTSSYLWRHVLRFMQNDWHCVAPDLMGLGDTNIKTRRKAFHMEAQSEMLLEFMQTLGYEKFSIVAHDQGGAAAQLLAARLPERIDSLVLTDCVCYDNWPVPTVKRLQRLVRLPLVSSLLGNGRLMGWLETRTPFSTFRRGVYNKSRLSDESIAEYLRPLRLGGQARAHFMAFLLAGSSRFTMQALAGLRRFNKPTLVLWAAEDRFISPSWGKKLYEDIPGAVRFELVPFCGHFWPEERPSEFASHMTTFFAEVRGGVGLQQEATATTATTAAETEIDATLAAAASAQHTPAA